jgi:DNA-directed RNA polymerase specialized sigma24 family protein
MLKVIGGYSFKEISALKNIPLGTATWLYQEARKKLEIKLKGAKN